MSTLKTNTIEAQTTNGDLTLQGNGTGDIVTQSDMIVNGALTVTAGNLLTVSMPAAAMKTRLTSGAELGEVETTTNFNMINTWDFDTAADEHVQFIIPMPKSWNAGTLTAQFGWSHDVTATNFGVAFGIQAVDIENDDGHDVAFGTAVVTTDTGGTTNDLYISAVSAAITVGGTPTKSGLVKFQVYRDVSDAFDDLGIDARLEWVKVFYNSDSLSDV